jgi:hypothetical protein
VEEDLTEDGKSSRNFDIFLVPKKGNPMEKPEINMNIISSSPRFKKHTNYHPFFLDN